MHGRSGERQARSATGAIPKREKQFIGGDSPSIADFRFAATLEFLRAIDYPFPDWAVKSQDA